MASVGLGRGRAFVDRRVAPSITLLGLMLVPLWVAAMDVPCTACHVDAVSEAGHPGLVHGTAGPACADCHGGDSGHPPKPVADAPGLMTFDDEPPMARAAACRGCHQDTHGGADDAHGQAGLACNDCHRSHGAGTDARQGVSGAPPGSLSGVLSGALSGSMRLDAISARCLACHAEVGTDFAFAERHRLQEGALSCTSCHDPHAAGAELTGAFAPDEVCADCHGTKTGPFVFEHGASRVEGCTACHAPHGSPNRHMLAHQREGELCYGCHVGVPGFHIGFAPGAPPRFDLDTQCTQCHTAIHGSNFDRAFLR